MVWLFMVGDAAHLKLSNSRVAMKFEALVLTLITKFLEVGYTNRGLGLKEIPVATVAPSCECHCTCSLWISGNQAFFAAGTVGLVTLVFHGLIRWCWLPRLQIMAHPDGKVEELSLCLPGDKVLVWYDDDSMYHERILIWKNGSSSWYVLTPDEDLYEESFANDGEGPSRFLIRGKNFWYYSRLDAPVYRFDKDPPEEEMKRHIETALDELGISRLEGDAWRPRFIRVKGELIHASNILGRRLVFQRMTRGGGVVQDPTRPASWGLKDELTNAVRPLTAAPSGKVWMHVSKLHEAKQAVEIVPEEGHGICFEDTRGMVFTGGEWKDVILVPIAGVAGIMEKVTEDPPEAQLVEALGKTSDEKRRKEELPKVAAEEVETNPDARVLDVNYDASGERYKEWRDVMLEVKEYQYPDWPLDGPLTTNHLVKHFQKFGGDPKRWLGDWMRSKQVQEGDRITFEMKVLVEFFFIAGTYDQLNLSGLASVEVIARRIQAVVDAYSAGPVPDWHASKVMTLYRSPDDAIPPQLRSWAARKNKEELDLAQSRAKFREGRKGL